MPFFNPHNPDLIKPDYSKVKPISVIASYNKDKKYIPLFFSYNDNYDDIHKIKIDFIKYTKDRKGCTTFCCLVSPYKRQIEVLLTFYVELHLWVLES